MWKNEKFGLTEKIFRQINSLVICIVKTLLSRKFCQKSVRLNFYNFHTVNSAQCGNYGNSLSRIFGKNFVKVKILLNKLLKSWFDEIFFRWERISRFSTLCTMKCRLSFSLFQTTGWRNEKFSLTKKNISSNQLFSTLFSKTVNFTKFLPKIREREFP